MSEGGGDNRRTDRQKDRKRVDAGARRVVEREWCSGRTESDGTRVDAGAGSSDGASGHRWLGQNAGPSHCQCSVRRMLFLRVTTSVQQEEREQVTAGWGEG